MRKDFLHSERLWLLWLFFLALFLRSGFVLTQTYYAPFDMHFYADDSGLYDEIATNLIEEKGYTLYGKPTAYEPPLYPLFLAALFLLFGKNFLLISLLQALLSSVSIILLYLLARQYFSNRVSLFAGLLFALYPHHIFWTGYILAETLYLFFVLLFLLFLALYQRSLAVSHLSLSSLFFVLASLTRPVITLFMVFVLLFLFLVQYQRKASKKQILQHLFLFLFLSLLFFSPWIVRNYTMLDTFILTTTKSGIAVYEGFHTGATGGTGGYVTAGIDFAYLENQEQLSEVEQSRQYLAIAKTFVRDNPMAVLQLMPKKFWNIWRPNYEAASFRNNFITYSSYLPLILFFLVGIWLSLRRRSAYLLLYLYLFYHIFFYFLFVGLIRYRLSVEPIMILFAAYGISELWKKITREPMLERYFQYCRIQKVKPYIPENSIVCDIGCGRKATFLRAVEEKIMKGIGIDLDIEPAKTGKLVLRRYRIKQRVPIPSTSVQCITLLADLGCFDDPEKMLTECKRILQKNGILILTAPMPKTKSLLRLLSRLFLLDATLVFQYRQYYPLPELKRMLVEHGFSIVLARTFQLGYNSLIIAKKQ